jgi:hypothetical protein
MPITIDPKNPSIPSMYGVPAQDTPAQGQSFVTATNTGTPRVINPLGTTSRGGKMGRGYGPNELPPLDDYFKSRALLEKVPSLSSIDNQTATSWANDYAQHFIAGALEGTYQRKVDKNEIDSHVARFNMQFANRLADFKAHLAQLENAGALSTTKPEDESNTSKFIKDQLGAAGDVPYQGGLDNPLTRGLAQSGNEALSGLGYVAGHPANTAKGLLANSLPVLIARKLSEKFKPEESQQLERFIHQNSDDPAVTKWVNEHFINPLTSEKFSKEGEQLQTPAGASAGQAALQFGSRVAGTLAQAGAGGEGAAALGASRLGARAAAAASYGVPAAGAAAQSMEDQGKKVDPEQMGKLISTAVATGLLPASLGGSLLKRLVGGAAIGVGANAASNAVAGNPLMQGALPAAAVGAGFGALPGHAGLKPEAKSGEEAPLTPPVSETNTAPAEGTAPNDAYSQAYQGVVENSEHQVKPGTPLEQATPTLIEALDQFNARYGALHEEATPEQRAQASAKFEDDWKKQFNVQEEKPQAQPQVKEVTPENKSISDQEAAQAVGENPAAETIKAGEVQPPQEPPQAAAAPEAPAEPLVLPGEAAPAPNPIPVRELATMPGVDPRLPLGVTERVAGELRDSLGRDPTAKEISDHAGLVLDEAMRQKGVDNLIPALARREAVGQLLEEHPTEIPEPEAINKRARKLQNEGLDQIIANRSKEFEKHPAVVAKKEAEQFRNALKKARQLPDTQAAGEDLAEIENIKKAREEAAKAEKEKAQAAEAKKKSDEEFRKVLAKARTLPTAKEKSAADFRNVLQKTREMPPPKGKAASQEGEAAYLRKAGEKDEFDNPVSGRAAHEVRKEIVDGIAGKIKGIGKELFRTLIKLDKLEVVQSMKDLPKEALAAYERHPEAGPIKGYYDPATEKSWLVADQLAPGEAVPTVLHEVGTHYGLQRMLLPSMYRELERYVEVTRHLDTPDGRELAKAYADAIAAKVHPRIALNETMATMITNRGLQQGSIWSRAFAQLKAFLYSRFGKHLPEGLANKLINNDTIIELARGAIKWTGKELQPALRATDVPWVDHPGAFSRAPTNFKTVEEVQKAWHQTTPPSKEEVAQSKVSRMQAWATKNVNELKPLQYLNRVLEKAGVKITPEKDIFGATTLLPSRAQFETDHDSATYVQPFLNKLVPIMQRLGFAKNPKEFLGHVNDAIAARHALERNKLLHYQTVRLTPEAEAQRAPILADIFKGKLAPEEYMPKLKAIVNKPGAVIEKTGTRMGSGLSDEMAYKLIESAKKIGITDKVAQEINEALEPIRQRTLENGLRSKRYTPEQRNIQKAYDFKWYVPFKGFAEDVPNGVDGSRRPLGAFNKDASYMEGRQTQSKNPLENLLADLTASSRDVAYNETAQTIFKATNDKAINSKLGTKVRAYDINKLTADALQGGGKLSDVESIFRNPNTVIYNNGAHRFSIEFPQGSKELEAIKSVQKENTLDGLTKGVGKLTNLFARAKTAYSPVFDLFTALVRDTSTYPLMAAVEHGPKVVANYAGNLAKFGGPLGAWRTYVGALRGKSFAEIEQRAQANPDSFAGWAYRLSKSGGGLDFKQELNNVKSVDDIAAKLAKTNKLDPRPVGKNFLNFLDAFATSSIATGRVSMFKALIESGMADREAGLYTKRLLNFQQSSEGSRRMNAYFAFWRAGIANADRLHELMHKPDGSFDRARFGKVMLVGVAAAAAWNAVLKAYYGDDAKKLTQDTLSKNFVLPIEYNGEPIKLPMGLGLPRLMLGLGMIGTRLAGGDANIKDTLEATKNTLFENLSPLKPSQSKDNATAGQRAMDLLMAAVPSPARPLAELERNETIFGQDIHTRFPKENEFRSSQGQRSTPNEWKELAKGVKGVTGVDVYPESLEYLANSYGAGFMTEALRAFVLENKEAQGKETSVVDYPFVPRFTTGDIKYASAKEFYSQREQLQDATKEVNTLKAEGKPIPAALQRQADEEKKLENAAREHSKAVKEIDSNHLLSSAARAQRLAQLNAQYKHVQEQLSREVERMQ